MEIFGIVWTILTVECCILSSILYDSEAFEYGIYNVLFYLNIIVGALTWYITCGEIPCSVVWKIDGEIEKIFLIGE